MKDECLRLEDSVFAFTPEDPVRFDGAGNVTMTQRTFDGLVRSLADLRRTRDLLCACEQWARRALVNEVPKEEALGAIIEYCAENEPCPACLARCKWGEEWQMRTVKAEGALSMAAGERSLVTARAEAAERRAEEAEQRLSDLSGRKTAGEQECADVMDDRDAALADARALRGVLSRCAAAMVAWGNEEDGIPADGLGKGINAFEAYYDARSILAAGQKEGK